MSVIMSKTVIPRYFLGTDASHRKSIRYTSKKRITYLAGSYITIWNSESNEQKLIPAFSSVSSQEKTSKGASCFAVSRNGSNICLVEDYNDGSFELKIFSAIHGKQIGTLTLGELSNENSDPVTHCLCIDVSDDLFVAAIVMRSSKDLVLLVWNFNLSQKPTSFCNLENIRTELFDDTFAEEGNDVEETNRGKISFHPYSTTLVAFIIGESFFVYRLEDGIPQQLGPTESIPEEYEVTFLDFGWNTSSKCVDLILIGENGELVKFDGEEVRVIEDEQRMYSSLASTTKGVYVSTDGPELLWYSQDNLKTPKLVVDLREVFRELKLTDYLDSISSLQVDKLEQTLLLIFQNGFLLGFYMRTGETYTAADFFVILRSHSTVSKRSEENLGLEMNNSPVDRRLSSIEFSSKMSRMSSSLSRMSSSMRSSMSVKTNKSEEVQGEQLAKVVLMPKSRVNYIKACDSCPRKSLLVTCGADKQIIFMDMLTNKMLSNLFVMDDILCISMHPSGNFLLMAHPEKVLFCNVLNNALFVQEDVAVKSCITAEFSNGGHLFAIGYSNKIDIYRTAFMKRMVCLTGHTGKVTSVAFSIDDRNVISLAEGGAVYVWDVFSGERLCEYIDKLSTLVKAIASENTQGNLGETKNIVYLFSQGGILQEVDLSNQKVLKRINSRSYISTAVLLQKLNVIIVGCHKSYSDGMNDINNPSQIRIYALPLSDSFTELPALAGQVNFITYSEECGCLVLAGSDGIVGLFTIIDYGRSQNDELNHISTGPTFINMSDYKTLLEDIELVQGRIEESKIHSAYSLKILQKSGEDSLKTLSDKFKHQIDALQRELTGLDREANRARLDYREYSEKQTNNFLKKRQRIEKNLQKKLTEVFFNKNTLLDKRKKLVASFETQHKKITKSSEAKISQAESKRIANEEQSAQALRKQEDIEGMEKQFLQILKERIKENNEYLYSEHSATFTRNLEKESKEAMRLRGVNAIILKKQVTFKQMHELKLGEISSNQITNSRLREEVENLQNQIKLLKGEVKSKDATISSKEKALYTLKMKSQELEKFKYVLDHKIRQMKSRIEPCESKIKGLQSQVLSMNRELENYYNANIEIDVYAGVLKGRLVAAQRNIRKMTTDVQKSEARISGFASDLETLLKRIQYPDEVQIMFKTFINIYQRPTSGNNEVFAEINKEYLEQQKAFQKFLEGLREGFEAKLAKLNQEKQSKIVMNMELLRKINSLRKKLYSKVI